LLFENYGQEVGGPIHCWSPQPESWAPFSPGTCGCCAYGDRGVKYCDQRVCVSLSTSVRSPTSKTHVQTSTFSVHVNCGHSCDDKCNTFFISGFMHDVFIVEAIAIGVILGGSDLHFLEWEVGHHFISKPSQKFCLVPLTFQTKVTPLAFSL